ncbi:ABC transporter permease [Streptomyces sp. NBC_01456]|uniref:ABC transporter permease n=1 Tax=unclassified Streptomyces TaxID=2593676 RepID=UPI002E34EAAF|nr:MULTISPECIES: ABC transporter permease [unclassified Streptomyces]
MTSTRTAGARPADAAPVPGGATPRRTLLHGLPWLVWRRHRTFLLLVLLTTAVGCVTFVCRRAGLTDFLHTHGTAPDAHGNLNNSFEHAYGQLFSGGRQLLTYLPVVAGVFLGAPLIAAEQEHRTLTLVSTQSVSRGRWAAATIGLPLAVIALCTALLSAAFTWLWAPAHLLAMGGDWLASGLFESTGPVPVAWALFLTVCGIALGMLVKRTVPAMAGAFVLAMVTSVLWSERLRSRLGTLRSISYPFDSEGPSLPSGAVRVDDWVSTADGRLYGYGTCTTGDTEGCRAKLGIVHHVAQYFDYEQMAGMQWRGAGILLALTALVLAFVVWRIRRRPL